ncbi:MULTISPECIES: ATP-grasp domain-containing protein [unclassified Micromonospora]|uniref:ATP-grasp domain-containing protein n=1 Tax=unclassified Micromonospora TaxID=2617518 RepID=UPI001034035E|nr:biotin carboxylase [Verrucosispora sp. SN26_14.1]TBL42559.1 biotin carboxylase [Verrucosispora sp. SN26_14.1]
MKPHILIIHRWRDHYAGYAEYLDHDLHHVTYVCTELATAAVPASAAAVALVAATDRLDLVSAAADGLIARFGVPERIVALNEGDLDTAAELRAHLGVAGDRPDRLARFRDKLVMAETVVRGGVAIPAFADAPDTEAVVRFADSHGWPLIVKPRRGTASRDVLRLNSVDDLVTLDRLPPEPRMVQTFCPDQVFHIDGLWTGAELGPWRASRYVNTCMEFAAGDVLGSVEVDDADLLGPLGGFLADACAAFGDAPWVFHMEAFVGTEADGTVRINFLEAGSRVGGAEIPFVWREVHGVDLMEAAIHIQLGRNPIVRQISDQRVGGWLLVPTPVPAPCRITVAELDLPAAEWPYARVIPAVGTEIPKAGGYEHVGARFRFSGAATDDVEKAIRRTAGQLWLECVPSRSDLPSAR